MKMAIELLKQIGEKIDALKSSHEIPIVFLLI